MVLVVALLLGGATAAEVTERRGAGRNLCCTDGAAAPSPRSSGGVAASVPEGRAAAVLRAWDRRRAIAYARGDRALLRALYTPGAGHRDVAALDGYLRRGLRVPGLRLQVLAVHVLTSTPRRVRVVVTDRVQGGEVLRPGAGVLPPRRHPLPRDRPSTRTMTLVRRASGAAGDRWRVQAIGPAPARRPGGRSATAASGPRPAAR